MSPNLTLALAPLGPFIVFFGICRLYWSYWSGPRAVCGAVIAKSSPVDIRRKLQSRVSGWVVAGVLGTACAIALAVFSWKYGMLWLNSGEVWQYKFARMLYNAPLRYLSPMASFSADPWFLPLSLMVAIFVGTVLGVLVGKTSGTKAAARRYIITRNLL